MNGFDISTISSVYVGSTQYSSIYKGSTLIWPINQQLPYDAEVEYLEGTGTQWIDTLIHPTTGYGFELYGGFTEFDNNEFFGGGNDWCNGLGICTHAARTYGIIVGTTDVCQVSETDGVMHLFRVNTDGTVYVDNVYKGQSNTSMPEGNYTMYIFNHSSTRTVRKAKIYYCKIFNNNGLVFDGIPVRVGLVGYMYDKVSGQLFGNQGTGNFILGRDKLPNGYTEVEYISSTNGGNLYIDLGIKLYEVLNTDYDIAIKFVISSTNSEGQATIFNCQDPNNSPWPGTYIRKNNSGSNVTGRYIGGSAKDNTIGQLNNIIELPVLASPNKNVTNINNNNSTHQYGTGLFCSFSDTNNTPQRYCNGTIYYFKLFVNGTLVRDLIPCINPNNVVGLYDLVNDVFYSSPNGNSFVAGPEIN